MVNEGKVAAGKKLWQYGFEITGNLGNDKTDCVSGKEKPFKETFIGLFSCIDRAPTKLQIVNWRTGFKKRCSGVNGILQK